MILEQFFVKANYFLKIIDYLAIEYLEFPVAVCKVNTLYLAS